MIIFWGAIFVSFPLYSDPVETLIDEQKSEEKSWQEEDVELPPVILGGNARSVWIYPNREMPNRETLCESLEIDEILALNQAKESDSEVKLNFSLPQVREAFSRSCAIRPSDRFVAVGRGEQTAVVVNRFVIRREANTPAGAPPFAVWAEWEAPLPESPLFFTTDTGVMTGSNGYRALSDHPVEPISPLLQKKMGDAIPFVDEFDIQVRAVHAPNCDYLASLERKVVSNDDEDLPNQAILVGKDQEWVLLLQEKVSRKRESGHVQLEGTLDYNGDGFLDLVVDGDDAGLPYRRIYRGTEREFVLEGFF